VIHKQFVPEGKAVNSRFCVQGLARSLKQILRERLQFQEKSSLFSLHDAAAAARAALIVRHFLANHGMAEISHLFYSPDLMPTDFLYSVK
jgi:hypothetical protein